MATAPAGPLVGIARMAAESDPLEFKRAVRYDEIHCRSLLNKAGGAMPFRWSINPYRGCEFACRYCYARYTHEFMELRDSRDFEDRIFAKADVGRILRKELAKVDGSLGIAIGTATDPYQPAERRFLRTREILEVFALARGVDLSITTKSDLVARDIDLLLAIGRHNRVSVNITVTTIDPKLARILEPRAPHPLVRLAAVRKLADAGVPVGVFPNPVMPLITDQEARLDSLAKAAKEHGAQWLAGGVLFLMPSAQRVFFPFLQLHYPHLLRRYRERYESDAYLKGPYREVIRERLRVIRARHGLAGAHAPHSEPSELGAQPGLFDVLAGTPV
jgi:DNA repair photolyase